jgi:hypothetical protein
MYTSTYTGNKCYPRCIKKRTSITKSVVDSCLEMSYSNYLLNLVFLVNWFVINSSCSHWKKLCSREAFSITDNSIFTVVEEYLNKKSVINDNCFLVTLAHCYPLVRKKSIETVRNKARRKKRNHDGCVAVDF